MPTGVHLRDARQQLFDAAERVLLRDGPNELTSRAVTEEAGCAKGVLHRHFADFDAFLTELVLDRAGQLRAQARELRETVGTGTVAGNLTEALTALFGPVPVAIIPLITFRDGLRARLRKAEPEGGGRVVPHPPPKIHPREPWPATRTKTDSNSPAHTPGSSIPTMHGTTKPTRTVHTANLAPPRRRHCACSPPRSPLR